MNLSATFLVEDSEREHWIVRVRTEEKTDADKPLISDIEVNLNIDTIVCKRTDGESPFKTYPWTAGGNVMLNATIAAIRYLAYCEDKGF